MDQTKPSLHFRIATGSTLVRRFDEPEMPALRQKPECDILHPYSRVQALAPRVNSPP